MSKAAAVETELPAAGELEALAADMRACAASPRHSRAFAFLRSLAASPPKSLLLEGGEAKERGQAALYWAMTLNCEAIGASPAQEESLSLFGGQGAASPAGASGPLPGAGQSPDPVSNPCYSCPSCLRLLARMHRDLFYLDGLAGTIPIDDVRAVRSVLGEAPREAKWRVVVLAEAQALSEAAANAMLKSLEEVRSQTSFVLLAPQRERLLPTLVSRSWVLTLAWPDPHGAASEAAIGAAGAKTQGWAETAARFLLTGQGLFERTSARATASGGGMDAAAAGALILTCQRALALALAKSPPQNPGAEADLAAFFASLPENRQRMADAILAEGQESVISQVNAGLVADWVMTRLFLLQGRR